MSTLSNVSQLSGGGPSTQLRTSAVPPCTGVKSSALPGNHSEGVSVENAPDETCDLKPETLNLKLQTSHWFVLRVSYGRIAKVMEMLDKEGVEYYVPMHYIRKMINGKKKLTTEPLLPNFVFIHSDATTVENLTKSCLTDSEDPKPYLTYYYDHFHTKADGKNPTLQVPDAQMHEFIKLTSIQSEHTMTVSPEYCHFKSGDLVTITDGEFKGITGRVARISGQQRVVVELPGLCMVATAYVPSAFLKPSSNNV